MMKQSVTPNIEGLKFSLDEINRSKYEKKPLLLTLYTSGICNVKCPSCFIENEDNDFNELSIEQYYSIIKEAKDMGINTIKISGAGEPLMDNRILEIVKYIKELEMKCVIYTNGTYLGDDILSNKTHGISSIELIELLYELDTSIVLKFNSFDLDLQDYFVGIKGAAQKMKKGLDNLLKFNFNNNENPKLAIQTILTPQNISEVPDIYRFARQNNITPYFETVLKKGSAKENNGLYLSKEEIKNIFFKLLDIDKNEFSIDWFPAPSFVGFFCTELYYGMLIDNFGYLKPCAGIGLKLGNYNEKPLVELWENEFLKKLRNIDENIQGNCKACEYRPNSCHYGCRADAFLNTNDVFGEYRECWWND